MLPLPRKIKQLDRKIPIKTILHRPSIKPSHALFFLLCLFTPYCSDKNDQAPSLSHNVHPESWINPEYTDALKNHGAHVRINATESCKLCHGMALEGADKIPGCSNTCHFDENGSKSPTGSGWLHGTASHSALVDNEDVCKKCHDIMNQFNTGPVSCHNCHGQPINHPLGQTWLDTGSGQFHGNSSLDCASCHSLTSDCAQCHFDSGGNKAPVGSGWTHGNNDQHKEYETSQAVCNKCHDLNRSYGNDPSLCHDCHDIAANHPLGQTWLDTKSSQVHGNSSLDCASCHSLTSDCAQCHFGSGGNKAPVGSGWTHGNNDQHKEYETSQAVCNKCHDLNRSYGNDPAACHDCHEIVSNHPLGQPWLDAQSRQFHGSSSLSCASCHSLISDCAQCHFGSGGNKAPVGSGWIHGNNDQHQEYETSQAVCNKCHDLNRSYGNDPSLCHDCHDIAANHPLGQTWLDTKSSQVHGNSSLDCASCHSLTSDCAQCHFGSGGNKAPVGSGWTHGNNDQHKEYETSQAVCNKCHDLNRSYGNDPAACHDCHEIVSNHPLGQTWLDTGSSQFHGSSSLSCASCHSLISDCAQCHFGSGGNKAPVGSGWIHGNNDQHQEYETSQAVCNKCHDLNRSYGNDPSLCHDCHDIVANHPLGQTWLDTKSGQFHGNSSLDCASCHSLISDCSQCHFGSGGNKAPVGSGWIHGNNDQHQEYETSQAVCNQCHTLDRSYGNGPASCHDCHEIVSNHPLGQTWLDTGSSQFHGNSSLNCASCHNLSTDCSQCHFGSGGNKAPVGSGWIHGNNDQHKNYANAQAVCNQCHGLDRSYGNGPASCHDCHEIVSNHPLGQPWLDNKSSQFHGNSSLDCASCHNLSTDCARCHFGSGGGKAPAGSGWIHGNNDQHKTYTDVQAVCNQCHGLDRSYGNGPASCHDCHEIVSNHPLGQPWLDNKSSQFHGNSSLDCTSCHNLSTDCSQCHFGSSGGKAPAGSGWIHGNNDQHKTYTDAQAVCNQCHSLDRSYGNGPASCHDCHEIVSNHPLGQPWLDTKSGEFHGGSSLNCASCHNLSTDCARCHFGSDGGKAPAGSGWIHGNNDQHQEYETSQAVCNQCHTLDRSYGNGPASCHDCHGDGEDD